MVTKNRIAQRMTLPGGERRVVLEGMDAPKPCGDKQGQRLDRIAASSREVELRKIGQERIRTRRLHRNG